MMNQLKPDKLYPLGPLENLLRQVYDHFDGEGATGTVVRVSGNICDDALRQSISIVQNRHPKLRSRFAFDDTGAPCFEVLDTPPPIPLKIFESYADHLRWQEVTQDSFYPPMDTRRGPLMRVSLLRHKQHGICDLILVCHHAICDARSLLRLTHDILSAYQSVHNQEASAKSVSLPLITASRIKLTIKLPHRIKTFLSCYRYIPQLRLKDWTKLPTGPDRYLPLWDRTLLSKSDTAMLIQKCRHFRTTVTGAMFAAGIIALGRMLKGNEHHIACRCPVNLITPSGYRIGLENIGCFVSTFFNIYAVNRKTDFWELARQAITDMKSFIDSQGPIMAFNMSHFLKFCPDSIPRRDNLSIDNLGISDLHPQYGPLCVREISVIGRRQFLGPSIMLIFCTINGCLNITFDVVDIPRDFYCAYRNEVIRILESNI